jgi:hypothetical protein
VSIGLPFPRGIGGCGKPTYDTKGSPIPFPW